MTRALLAALLSLALAGPVRAQEPAEDSKKAASMEEARQHVAKAKVHYDLGEFEQAAEEYILVYRIKPVAAILFNVAQAYRQAGKYEKARQFYKSYLRELPAAKNKVDVEKAIRELDELLAKEKRTRDGPPRGVTQTPAIPSSPGDALPPLPGAPPAAPPALSNAPAAQPGQPSTAPAAHGPVSVAVTDAKPPAGTAEPASTSPAWKPSSTTTHTVAPPPERSHTLAYVAAGAAVVFLGGGIAFTMKASSVDNELNARPHPTATIDDLVSQSKSSHTMGALLLAAGVAAGVGAGILYFAF